jgi:large subunit ribosomal protein L29
MENIELKDIEGMDNLAIERKVLDIRTELFNFRMQKAASGIEKPQLLKIGKKNIARLLTVKNSRKAKSEK